MAVVTPDANKSGEQANLDAWADAATRRLIDVFWNEEQERFHKQ